MSEGAIGEVNMGSRRLTSVRNSLAKSCPIADSSFSISICWIAEWSVHIEVGRRQKEDKMPLGERGRKYPLKRYSVLDIDGYHISYK